MQAARIDRARAIGDALAALKILLDCRVSLVTLEFIERAEVRVAVTQAHDKADRDLIVFKVIAERAAVGVALQRPAGGVYHQARLVFLRFDLPQFLEADAVKLRFGICAQLEFVLQLFAEVPAAALGEQRVLGAQFHAGLVGIGFLAILAYAHVTGGYANDRAFFVIEHFTGGEAGEDFHAQALGLLPQPAA